VRSVSLSTKVYLIKQSLEGVPQESQKRDVLCREVGEDQSDLSKTSRGVGLVCCEVVRSMRNANIQTQGGRHTGCRIDEIIEQLVSEKRLW
jgi:hypothetical protein